MQIQMTGQQIDLGDSLREYAEKALTEAVSKYLPDAAGADIHISKDGAQIKTEVTVRPASGAVIRVTGASGDAYAAFDGAVDKLNRQLRKYKNRLVEQKLHKHESVRVSVISADNDADEINAAPVIIAETAESLPVCPVAAAVMYMDLAGISCLVFKNPDNDTLNAVYRRADGNIGWINPKKK